MATALNSIDTRIPRAGVSCTRSSFLIGRYFFPDKGAHGFHGALSIVSAYECVRSKSVGGLEIWDFRVDEFLCVTCAFNSFVTFRDIYTYFLVHRSWSLISFSDSKSIYISFYSIADIFQWALRIFIRAFFKEPFIYRKYWDRDSFTIRELSTLLNDRFM